MKRKCEWQGCNFVAKSYKEAYKHLLDHILEEQKPKPKDIGDLRRQIKHVMGLANMDETEAERMLLELAVNIRQDFESLECHNAGDHVSPWNVYVKDEVDAKVEKWFGEK